MLRISLILLGLCAALPTQAQEQGGLRMRNSPSATLDQIEANQGCPLSATSVTVGVNKATNFGASAQQNLQTTGKSTGCHPLVSTQVVAGVNLALGNQSNVNQSISAQGTRGVLSSNTYTRGYNLGYGTASSANQRLMNVFGR
jgi:hypothetical protein